MTAGDWLCTTVLRFVDRAEGQILCIGSREDCDKVARLLPAVIVNGDECPDWCGCIVVEVEQFGKVEPGERWRCWRDGPPTLN